MRFGETSVVQSAEIEIQGVLQKKNRNGFYQNRYFRTKGVHFMYWLSYEKFLENNSSPSSTYDFREVSLIQYCGDKCFLFQFMNEKFKLELRGISDQQCKEWVDFCKSKQLLYSVDQLKSNIDEGELDFQTKTFRSLLVLGKYDQVR
jgi:hypothetical protein